MRHVSAPANTFAEGANNTTLLRVEVVRDAVEDICSSAPLARAHKRQRMLRELLAKYVLGEASSEAELLEIYKPENGSTSPNRGVVRVEMSKLKKGLEAYYKGAGRKAHVILSIDRYRLFARLSTPTQVTTTRSPSKENLSKAPVTKTVRPARSAFTANWPTINVSFLGRQKELGLLDRVWRQRKVNVLHINAEGGSGKTALIDRWFRQHLLRVNTFAWSFGNQGGSRTHRTTTEEMFDSLIAWLGIKVPKTANVYVRMNSIAQYLRSESILIVIDGVEVFQDAAGEVIDPALNSFLKELRTDNAGLLICTSRMKLNLPREGGCALGFALQNFTASEAVKYLQSFKLRGTRAELEAAAKEYWCHPLSLTLLATYLRDHCAGEIRRRTEIASLTDTAAPEAHQAARILSAYDRLYGRRSEGAVLRALGHFNGPAQDNAVQLLLTRLPIATFHDALRTLAEARLLSWSGNDHTIDCHPIVRAYFARYATPRNHERLFHFYATAAPERPDTLKAMVPLWEAVFHGCKAGRWSKAFREIYRPRILRDGDYLTGEFGAFGTNLSLLVNFFTKRWTQTVLALSKPETVWVLGEAGRSLRAMGLLVEAKEPLQLSIRFALDNRDWTTVAQRYSQISELELSLGDVRSAKTAGHLAVQYAARTGNASLTTYHQTTYANALHRSGELDTAEDLFRQAETAWAGSAKDRTFLESLPGYRYCDLLLTLGDINAAATRARYALEIAKRHKRPLDTGLAHLSLGRALKQGSDEALFHLDSAVRLFDEAGDLQFLPIALLQRRSASDLPRAFEIAARSDMRLRLAEYHVASALIAQAEGRMVEARNHSGQAYELIEETGYYCLRRDLRKLNN